MGANPWTHLEAPALDRLDLASVVVREIFDTPPYLVGSCLERPDYRDVDIRVILDDDRYAQLFTRPPAHHDPLRHLAPVHDEPKLLGIDKRFKVNGVEYVVQESEFEQALPVERSEWESWLEDDDD